MRLLHILRIARATDPLARCAAVFSAGAACALLCHGAFGQAAEDPPANPADAGPATDPDPELSPVDLLRQSRAAFDGGDYTKAESLFEQFQRDYGSSEEAREAVKANRPLLALCKIQLKEFEAAGALIDEALLEEKIKPRLRQELRFWRGVCYMQGQDYTQAQHTLGKFFGDPAHDRLKRFEALILFGTCYTLLGYHATAAEFYAVQVPKLRDDPAGKDAAGRAVVLRLYSLLQDKDHEGALQLVREEYPRLDEITQIVSFQSLTLELGSRFLDAGKYHEAIACLQRIWTRQRLERHQSGRLEAVRKHLEVVKQRPERRASVFVLQGIVTRIERELENFRKLENFDSALRLRLATAFQGLGRYREAALVMDDMLTRMDPDAIVESATLATMQCWMQIARWPRAAGTADIYMEKFGDVERYPNLPMVLFLKAQALQNDENYAGAADLFGRIAEAYPQSKIAPKAQFMRGFVSLLQDEYDQALEVFARYPDEYPQASRLLEDAFYWQGMCLSFKKEYKAARAHMEQYLERYAARGARYGTEARFRIAFCTFGMADYPAAIAQLENFLETDANDPLADEAKLLLGDALLGEGEIERGIAVYKNIRPVARRFFEDGWFKTGKALRLREDHPGMRAHFEQFLRENPGSSRTAEAVYWIGWTHRTEGNPGQAREIYLEILRERGDLPEDYAMADIFSALPKVFPGDEGRSALLKELDGLLQLAASAGRPTLALRTLWARAQAEARANPERARATLLEASKTADAKLHNPRLVADCADALRESGNELLAEELYKGIRKWHPRAIEKDRVYAGLGMIAMARGQKAIAIEYFEKFENETFGSPLLGKILLSRAGLQLEEGQRGEARRTLEGILEDARMPSRDKALALFALADLFSEENELKKAAAYYERIYVAYGKYRDLVARAYYRRGQVLEQLEMPAKSLDVYRELAAREDLSEFEEFRLSRARAERLALDVEFAPAPGAPETDAPGQGPAQKGGRQ